jgi:hypothetical protein
MCATFLSMRTQSRTAGCGAAIAVSSSQLQALAAGRSSETSTARSDLAHGYHNLAAQVKNYRLRCGSGGCTCLHQAWPRRRTPWRWCFHGPSILKMTEAISRRPVTTGNHRQNWAHGSIHTFHSDVGLTVTERMIAGYPVQQRARLHCGAWRSVCRLLLRRKPCFTSADPLCAGTSSVTSASHESPCYTLLQ